MPRPHHDQDTSFRCEQVAAADRGAQSWSVERLRRLLRGADRAAAPALPIGEAMHPVTLLLVAVLVVNDWVLKARWPGAVTGKLSDIAGLGFAPVVFTAGIGLVLHAAMRLGARIDPSLSARRLALACAATALVFAAIKVVAPVRALFVAAIGHGAAVDPDWTDLLCLPCVLVAWWIGRDELRRVPLGRPAAIHARGVMARAALGDVVAAGADAARVDALATAIDAWDVAAIDAGLRPEA
jgi:hypothetical protein